jgi:hypothetical protein
MTWKKYFKTYDGVPVRPSDSGSTSGGNASSSKYSSWLPEVYMGQPNRAQRYGQYDQMDMDSEVNAALDTIAEFSTLFSETTKLPFSVQFNDDPSFTENEVLQKSLRQWCSMNQMNKRIFRIFRNTVKYGDQLFVRDPETYKLYWVNPAKVEKVVVNEGKGKKIEAYYIKDLDINMQSLNITADTVKLAQTGSQQMGIPTSTAGQTQGFAAGSSPGSRFADDQTSTAIDAKHVIHVSLSEGIDQYWPFGTSMLEPVFKVYKQKELLEDSIIIYRVQRAPERRVFYIDVGDMPTHKARQHLERIKNEIHQRRIPSKTGGGANVVDSAYNPLSIMEDYFFAQTAEGRGSKVETLPGGENLGQIDDLKFFNDKLLRGLRVPPSYLGGMDANGSAFNDGRTGTAMIQEFRFTKYCERLQQLIVEELDKEFKMFLKHRGVMIESSSFDLAFNTVQNFGKYRQAEVDQVAMNVFTSVESADYISKRFAMKRFLGLSEEEILENSMMWKEENDVEDPMQGSDDGLKGVGASPGPGGGDFDGGAEDFDDLEGDDEEGSVISGAENAEDDTETDENV